MDKLEARVLSKDFQPRWFQAFIVKAIEVVNSDDLMARLQKPLRDMESNKSGAPSEQYPFHTETSLLQIRQTVVTKNLSRKFHLIRQFPGN
jgi:hypothetical protein